MPSSTKSALAERAKEHDRSLAAEVRRGLRLYLEDLEQDTRGLRRYLELVEQDTDDAKEPA